GAVDDVVLHHRQVRGRVELNAPHAAMDDQVVGDRLERAMTEIQAVIAVRLRGVTTTIVDDTACHGQPIRTIGDAAVRLQGVAVRYVHVRKRYVRVPLGRADRVAQSTVRQGVATESGAVHLQVVEDQIMYGVAVRVLPELNRSADDRQVLTRASPNLDVLRHAAGRRARSAHDDLVGIQRVRVRVGTGADVPDIAWLERVDEVLQRGVDPV